MKLQKQLIKSDPLNGVRGDCYRTTLACLLDMEAKNVPHFYEETFSDNKEEWDVNEAVERWIDEWLRLNNHMRIKFALSGVNLENALNTARFATPENQPMILSGQSRGGGPHAVIVVNGKIVWDTSYPEVGIAGPMDGWWIFEWVVRPLVEKP